MWRHERMGHRQSGEQRDPQQQEGRLCLADQREEHRRQQDEADLEEDGQADDQRREHDRPLESSLAQSVDQRARDNDGAARFREQLADHRAEADDNRGEAQRVADPLLKRAGISASGIRAASPTRWLRQRIAGWFAGHCCGLR